MNLSKAKNNLDYSITWVVYLTDRCNLSCKYCYQDRLNKEQDLEVLDKLEELLRPNDQIWWFGGEPTLHEKLPQLIERFSKHEQYLLTNGLIVTDELLQAIQKYKVNVQVSLDSIDLQQLSSLIPQFSNPALLQTLFVNLRKFSRVTRVQTNTVLSDFNVTALGKLAEKLSELKLTFFWNVIPDANWREEHLEIYRQQLQHVISVTQQKLEEGLLFVSSVLIPHFHNMIYNGVPYACGAGAKLLSIGIDGKIYECHRVPYSDKFKHSSRAKSIFDFKTRQEIYEHFNQPINPLLPECRKCDGYFFCKKCAIVMDLCDTLFKKLNSLTYEAHLELMEWLLENGYEWAFKIVLDEIAQKGDLLKFFANTVHDLNAYVNMLKTLREVP